MAGVGARPRPAAAPVATTGIAKIRWLAFETSGAPVYRHVTAKVDVLAKHWINRQWRNSESAIRLCTLPAMLNHKEDTGCEPAPVRPNP